MGKPIRALKLKNGLTIYGGERSQIFDIADEIFVQKVYNPKFMQLKKGSTVVDIGANVGIYGLYAAIKSAKCIYSIEPLAKNVLLIKKNFRTNNFGRPTIINAAVTNRQHVARFYLADFDSHGMLYSRSHNKMFTKYISVRTISFKNVVEKYRIKVIDFLKIDCEGSEGDIIYSTPRSIWTKVNKIAIEYHNGVSKFNNVDILQRLHKLGFRTKLKCIDPYLGYIYAWK